MNLFEALFLMVLFFTATLTCAAVGGQYGWLVGVLSSIGAVTALTTALLVLAHGPGVVKRVWERG